MNLNPAQLRAVNSQYNTLLCLAGPGSGKTATLIARLQRLIWDGCNPTGFAVITYTNAAADEIKKRLGESSHLGDCLGYCGTLHGFCLKLLQKHGHLIDMAGRLTVLDEQQAAHLLEQVSDEMSYKMSQEQLSEAVKRGPLPIMDAPVSMPYLVARQFFKTLRAGNLLTFDTVLFYAKQLLARHTGQVKGWTHLFVDEFQDASDADVAIYDLLQCEFKFFVGDPDQAIYGFRGGNVDYIHGRAYVARQKGNGLILLEDNYRSDLEICQAAQRLIEHNTSRTAKITRAVSDRELGIVAAGVHPREQDEIRWIAGEIHAKAMTCSQDTVAVLLRTNRLVDQYRQGLEACGIPVARKQVKQYPQDWRKARALLALLNDPDNDVLAYLFLELSAGRGFADGMKLDAAAACQTINDFSLHIPVVALAELPGAMAKANLSRESIALVEESIKPEHTSIADLLLALAEQDQATEETGHGVTVTTMHAAKGREWDMVFLPAFEQGIIPNGAKSSELEEERRLAYVAMTRARHTLLITFCEQRQPPFARGWVKAEPSQFIHEAGL